MKGPSGPFFDRIKTFSNLPSLPQILLRLIEACNSEESSIEEISKIIKQDSALSAKVMRMVNSPYYGSSPGTTGIDQALVRLGIGAIRNIAVSASVSEALRQAGKNAVLDLKVFWRHSLMCASIARLVARKTGYPSPDEAFLSGLLHDIGRLVLWENFPEEYAGILTSAKDREDLILAGEARYGASHCEVGAWLIEEWKLQSFMADAVLYHHESVERIHNAFPLIKIVYLANILCPETGKAKAVILGIAESLLGFEKSEVEDLVHQAGEEVNSVARSLGIEIGPADEPGEALSLGDEEKRQELIREAKDISLLFGTLRNLLESHEEDSILKAVRQGLQILFDVRPVSFFLYDQEKDVLVARALGGKAEKTPLHEISIPLKEEKSIMVKALLQEKPLDSFTDTTRPTIMDEQIIRFMGKEGVFCLPMVVYRKYIGVMVLGMDRAGLSHLSEQKRLLTMFTRQATLALHTNLLCRGQARLIQSERLIAFADLARRIVQETNTPLSIIKNYLSVLSRKLAQDKPVEEELGIINGEVDRVAEMIGRLSDFSDPANLHSRPTDINALISDLIDIFRESCILRKDIKTHIRLDPSLPSFPFDKRRMKQIFIHLLQNVIEVMPSGGGNIYIVTRYIQNRLESGLAKTNGILRGNAEIIIRDDGPGIPETLKPYLFEPFTTSKGAGHAGLGLSVVYNIVKESKGTITCTSDESEGTRFKILFPIGDNP